MKIKGKSKEVLQKAYYRIKKSSPIKAGYIKSYFKCTTTQRLKENKNERT